MSTLLRLTQSTIGPTRFRVEASLEAKGLPREIATGEFDFSLTRQDREDLRWYLEDYLQHFADPAPKIAARIEQRIAELGTGLFRGIFQANDDFRDLWARLRNDLNDTRVEIVTEVREATLPWELLRDPKSDAPLALRAKAFVRAAHQVAQRPHLPRADGPISILLVICRPGGSDDVPFRSVASRLIKTLGTTAREAFELEVLRPPTFESLSKVLRAAKQAGKPYDVVHFDGHGMYEEISSQGGLAEVKRRLSSLVLSSPRSGTHGYLLFENPNVDENMQLVDGPALGKLLAETDVPVLVLNACRSAHAEAPPAPSTAPQSVTSQSVGQPTDSDHDVHTKVRAFGSLAQEVVDAGVAGVVAMRYNVYVVTAAQFVADLYESLARGQTLGEAVTLGRKQLEAQPLREIAYEPRPLQDWMVPIIYEAAPVALFDKPAHKTELKITVSADAAVPSSDALDPELEKRPDVGFFGRDETLLALDRAFDTQAIVLLHAYAGSGKTSTAAEFARWYHLTGGIDGPVLFTSFERYKPLTQVLNETVGPLFSSLLERAGIHWPTLTDKERRNVALQVMAQIPVLWIWDNVEPISGFPRGTESAWSDAEQQALADFLRAAKQTKAKFLLTSRRDEHNWLGDLAMRIPVPPMPMQERVQLAQALAQKRGRRLTEVEDWMPLFTFTRGNPLTITALVGQALRDGLKTKAQIVAFVERLSAGEAAFTDEASEGRDKSLGASLSYGFEHAFSEVERRQLALLHLFQGFVDVQVLRFMGNPQNDRTVAAVRDLSKEAAIALLDRASEIGLLKPHGDGFYAIHPALPWFFKRLFDQYYRALPSTRDEGEHEAIAAFVDAIGAMSSFYHIQSEGHHHPIMLLAAEEANLLYARRLAIAEGWWDSLVSIMQGLFALYSHRSRWIEWKRLVDEIVPNIMDPVTNEPLQGREDIWKFVIDYRVRLAFEERQWDEAERLQSARVSHSRIRAAKALSSPFEQLDEKSTADIRSLAVALGELALIQREQGKSECFAKFDEARRLCQRLGDGPREAAHCLNLGVAYLILEQPPNLKEAESCFQRGLQLTPELDRLGRSKFLSELGFIARERMRLAIQEKESSEILKHLTNAIRLYENALELTPEDAVASLAVKHQSLGDLYRRANLIDRSLEHTRDAIRYHERDGNRYGVAAANLNMALAFYDTGRLLDAKEYAEAALSLFESYGPQAISTISHTRRVLALIAQALQGQGN